MKNIFIGLIAVWGLFLVSCETREPMAEVIERGLEVSKRQAVFLAKEVENQKGRLPRNLWGWWTENIRLPGMDSGFFPGVLWYLYENDPTEELKRYAELYTSRVEPAKNMTSTHDLGFMLYCSFGNGYRLITWFYLFGGVENWFKIHWQHVLNSKIGAYKFLGG